MGQNWKKIEPIINLSKYKKWAKKQMNSFWLLEVNERLTHETNSLFTVIYFFFPLCLALLHIFIGKLNWIDSTIPKDRWLSLGGGVSIAYVFLEILPELNQAQLEIESVINNAVLYLEKHVYLLALIGLLIFYGLELLVQHSRQLNREAGREDGSSLGIFWIHIGAFAIYNALIGELLSNTEERGLVNAIILCIALGLHFLINDHSLREHHKAVYDNIGRWVLAAFLVFGWIIGQAVHLDKAAVAAVWAFVAGGIILNALKEELPSLQHSRFWSFALGLGGYTLLLLTA